MIRENVDFKSFSEDFLHKPRWVDLPVRSREGNNFPDVTIIEFASENFPFRPQYVSWREGSGQKKDLLTPSVLVQMRGSSVISSKPEENSMPLAALALHRDAVYLPGAESWNHATTPDSFVVELVTSLKQNQVVVPQNPEIRKIPGEFKKFFLSVDSLPLFLNDTNIFPFQVQRVYFVNSLRLNHWQTGQHAHKVEEEVFVVLNGSTTLVLGDGNGEERLQLQSDFRNKDAVYIPNFYWHGFEDSSSDCVIAAFSSTVYDPTRFDYLEKPETYKKLSRARDKLRPIRCSHF